MLQLGRVATGGVEVEITGAGWKDNSDFCFTETGRLHVKGTLSTSAAITNGPCGEGGCRGHDTLRLWIDYDPAAVAVAGGDEAGPPIIDLEVDPGRVDRVRDGEHASGLGSAGGRLGGRDETDV
jgi:hypothetical protein